MHFKAEKGNALFLILIAVVLFAALSYAVTSSMRGGGKDMSDEAADIAAARILDYSAHLRMTIQRMMVSQYLNPEDIDFFTNSRKLFNGNSLGVDNTHCTTTSCEIFSPNGGGLSYQHFEDIANPSPSGWMSTWAKPGHWLPKIINVVNVGSTKNDVAIRVLAIDLNLCKAINRKVGLPDVPNSSFAGETNVTFSNDVSTKMDTPNPWTFGDDFPDLKGANDFCRIVGDHGNFWSVLIAR